MIFNVANSKPTVPYTVPQYTINKGSAPALKYSGDNWEMAFTATGETKITFQRVSSSIDVFIVGGGAAGSPGAGSGTGDSANAIGGAGGKGGGCRTVTVSVKTGTQYTINIGGSGQSSSAFGYSASSGTGANGGVGAYQKGTTGGQQDAGAGTDGTVAFSSGTTLFWNGYKYGAGGGGGGAMNGQYGNPAAWKEGAYGGLGYVVDGQTRRAGGQGGISTYATGKAGAKNSGGGGGGGASDFSNQMYTNFPGGAGGSGIVIIRNHR